MAQLHGQLGYNLYQHDMIGLNPAITTYIAEQQQHDDRLIDYAELSHHDWGEPTQVFPIHDPVAYGVVVGLLWKITSSLKFRDIQILQIILFVLSLLLIFSASCYLLDIRYAVLVAFSVLAYLPIVAMAVQPGRDIWAFYGSAALFYIVIRMLYTTSSAWLYVILGAWFALCQFMRPTIVTALILLTVVCFMFALHQHRLRMVMRNVNLLWLMNILCFWLPFCAYNYHAYQRYFVGPVGQNLIEGLGEFDNPWGYQLNDAWIARYIFEKYGYAHGQAEFDDVAKAEFWLRFAEDPVYYFKTLCWRAPQLVLPPLAWITYKESPYKDYHSTFDKLKAVATSKTLFLDFLLRVVYIRIFLLLGYLGLVYLIVDKRYWHALLMIAFIICGWATFPSHIECRYLVPFYWAFAFGVAYVLWRWYKTSK